MSHNESDSPLFGPQNQIEVTPENRERLLQTARDQRAAYDRGEIETSSYQLSHSTPPPARATVHKPTIRAESSSGRVLSPSELTRDSMVFLGSEQVSLGVAESIGWIERGPNGELIATKRGREVADLDADVPAEREPTASAPDRPPEQEAEAKDDDASMTLQKAWADSAEQIADLPQAAFNQAQEAYLSEDGTTIEAIADMLGEPVEAATPRVEAMENAYRLQGNEIIASAGVHDADAFLNFAEATEHAPKFREAVKAQIRGDYEPLKQLASTYRIAAANLETSGRLNGNDGRHTMDDGSSAVIWTDKKGNVWFKHEDADTESLAAAVLSGTVKLRR